MSNDFRTKYNSTLKMCECGQNEYWFYHKALSPNDEPMLYKKLISEATSNIIIWDPYFNIRIPDENHKIFDNVNSDITIKILTIKGLSNSTYINDVVNAVKSVIPQSKDCSFGLRVIDRGDIPNQGELLFHDRFLIIDNTEVYLIGSSITHHTISKNSTGIYKVCNPETAEFIKSIFDHYWSSSSAHGFPLRLL